MEHFFHHTIDIRDEMAEPGPTRPYPARPDPALTLFDGLFSDSSNDICLDFRHSLVTGSNLVALNFETKFFISSQDMAFLTKAGFLDEAPSLKRVIFMVRFWPRVM